VRQLLYLGSGKNNGRYDSLMQKATRLLETGELTDVCQLHDDIADLELPLLPSANLESPGTGQFSFTAWGDSQGGWPVFDQIVKQMTTYPDAFSIGLGDLVAEGVEEAQWMAFTQCLQPLLAQRPIFAVAGNHDYDGYYNDLNPLLYRRYVLAGKDRPTYFSWTYGNAFFLALDPNGTFPIGISGAQRAWMEAEMNSPEWESADWRFVLIHQPPYAQGWPEYHGDDFIREIVDSLAESKRIDFVLAGHSHDYERLSKTYGNQQTHFFVLGGAGGGLEPPESSAYPKMDTIIKAHHYARFTISKEQVKVLVHAPDSAVLDAYTVYDREN
jgi:predicted phosphodiesterase